MSLEKINQLRMQIMELRGQVATLQKALPVEAVKDYRFESESGAVSLSSLLADKQSLYVVHNMGTSCNYCMLWADGFNGVSQHLQDYSAFVISSPDSVETQQAYRSERGWDFPMVSVKNNTFAADMGFTSDEGYLPGVSVFKRDGNSIVRVGSSMFGPGDDFCAVWHLLDLTPEGAHDWQPRKGYI